MELQKVKYISDTPDVELAATIKKFCDLVEMQPPSQAKEFINLLRLGFGRYPFEMFENAFTMWMLKRSEVRATKICNIKWISDVLNEYIENNRHILQRKPKAQHIAIEAPKVEAPDLQKIVKNMFVEVTANHIRRLYFQAYLRKRGMNCHRQRSRKAIMKSIWNLLPTVKLTI
jgi:hypothetical protein